MTLNTKPSINDGFALLAKNTDLSLGEYTSITQSQAEIELYLRQHHGEASHGTFSTVLNGAFSRKTIVSPLFDNVIDLLVLYRDSNVKHSYPSRIFTKLTNSLIKQYPEAYVIEGKNTLMLPVKNFKFRIQPGYLSLNNSYMLPSDLFNEWVDYDIHSYDDIFVRENVRHKGRLIEIIRMIKTWNRVSGQHFNGYYLELLVTTVLRDYEIKSYSETLRHIFYAALSEVVFQKQDPANTEFQVEGLNDISDLISTMVLLKKSYKLASEAIFLEEQEQTAKALEIWNKIFPQVFPTQLDMVVGKARDAGIRGTDALRMMINQK
ncbi:hypothetical protein MNBD_GAMMA05-1387 [hydrothermal vent metagenome]|uniref:Nucleotidyltransferase n=1 Tax=hydrothermal vent metagenome TaxID=652676 RepID=A0A3B0X157_9ZZZZ